MFRLHKSKPAKSGDRIDFKFSQFKALQVPKGWDKLFVSIVSVETGKTIAKSSKAAARNGNCQWADTVSESIWVPHDAHSSKELENCPYKIVVAMGSARYAILGEAIVNIATYTSSSEAVVVSSPLKKCSHGTTLQLKIQCLTPRIHLRENDSSNETNSRKEDIDADSHQEAEIKSEESDNLFAKSARSYSSKDLSSITNQEDSGTKGNEGATALQEATLFTSDSYHSYDSAESSLGKEVFSPLNNLNGDEETHIARHSSQNSVPQGSSSADNASRPDHSPVNSRIMHSENLSQDDHQELAAQPLKISGSSKSLLEAAEETIVDLQDEAKMWERNARKLTLELEILKKEYSKLSKNQVNLDVELLAARAERDGLQKEVERLKLSLEKSAGLEDSAHQDEGVAQVLKELENEIKFQKEYNANLTLQLHQSQESNVELVSVLQALEDTVEKQKSELQKNQELEFQIQQSQESEKNLQSKMQELENALQEKTEDHKNLLDTETEYKCMLSAKEKEIISLKAKLLESEKQRHDYGNLIREIESLKAKLQELESDCQELTDENLELLLKLKEMKKNSAEGDSNSRFFHECQVHDLEEKMRKEVIKEIELDSIQGKATELDNNHPIQELERLKLEMEGKVTELSKELNERREVIERLEAVLLLKEVKIGNLQSNQRQLQDKLSVLQKEKRQLEENVDIVTRESDIATKCLNDLQKDLMVLSSSVDTHVSANKILERRSSELESDKRELETHLLELEQENKDCSACISGLETQLRNLKDEKELMASELENSKSNADRLQTEIARLRNEIEEIHSRWSEAQEELKHLRSANPKLQATAESLMEECSSLQKSNGELERQKMELQEHCNQLETKLRESHRSVADCSKKVTVLQENICSLLEDSASKERSLSSELEVLLKENEKQNKKLGVLDQMYFEKMVQVENIEREVEDLTKQLSATQDERERIAYDAVQEVSGLRTNIAKLESEVNTTKIESKTKIQDLMDELTSSKQNQEMLTADKGKMLKLLENYRSCEEKFKTALNGLELKLTVSEYERQQLVEESTNLKAQLLKIETFQDEVLTLKNEVNAIKCEREKLQASLRLKSEECQELQMEKNLCIDKITDLQKTVAEFEECKHENIALEEKLQQLESDLTAKETVCKKEEEARNELSRIKRTNKQLQQQVQQLQDENKTCGERTQSLEKELISMREKQRYPRESRNISSPSNQHLRDGENPNGFDSASKTQLLEDELSRSMEANNAYKVQVKRLTSEGRKGRTGSPRTSKAEGEYVPKERFERTKSSLEAELRDLRERYFHMSLQYAEVEAQREELVMKLKTVNNTKRWF